MYNVQLDENKFYTGTYAKIGKVINGVDVNELPPSTSYQLVSHEKEKTRVVNVIEYYIIKDNTQLNEDTNKEKTKSEIIVINNSEIASYEAQGYTIFTRNKTDENGTPVTKQETYTEQVKSWVYDASKETEINNRELNEVKKAKLNEISEICQATIFAGTDVTFSDGMVRHFSMKMEDQINILTMSLLVMQGVQQIPYHEDKNSCTFYTQTEATKIATQCTNFKTYHLSYCNQLNMQIREATDIDVIRAMYYGMELDDTHDAVLVNITGVSSKNQ